MAAAIVNAFVHSRDAYGVVPAAIWLSACTVLLMGAGSITDAAAGLARSVAALQPAPVRAR